MVWIFDAHRLGVRSNVDVDVKKVDVKKYDAITNVKAPSAASMCASPVRHPQPSGCLLPVTRDACSVTPPHPQRAGSTLNARGWRVGRYCGAPRLDAAGGRTADAAASRAAAPRGRGGGRRRDVDNATRRDATRRDATGRPGARGGRRPQETPPLSGPRGRNPGGRGRGTQGKFGCFPCHVRPGILP